VVPINYSQLEKRERAFLAAWLEGTLLLSKPRIFDLWLFKMLKGFVLEYSQCMWE